MDLFQHHFPALSLLKTHDRPAKLITDYGRLRQIHTSVLALLARGGSDIVTSDLDTIFGRRPGRCCFGRDLIGRLASGSRGRRR